MTPNRAQQSQDIVPFDDSSLASSLTWSTTGLIMNFIERTLNLNLTTEGLEQLHPQPTLYVVNHFTRIETFILPYLLHKRAHDAPRSLAHHSLFKGTLGRYISSLGAVSTKEPLRNRLVIGDLMTGRKNWVIYPEGVMVKNKKYIESGKYMLNVPSRKGPPRTGAAVLALKAALCKSTYFKACSQNNTQLCRYLEERYQFNGPQDLSPQDIVITPVNITYYPIRPSRNLVSRLARKLIDDIPESIEEELKFEGNVLLGQTDMHIRFCPAVPLSDYIFPKNVFDKSLNLLLPTDKRTAYTIEKQRTPLTQKFMEGIYTNLSINIDHLFCHGIRKYHATVKSKSDFHKALVLTTLHLKNHTNLHLHRTLSKKIVRTAIGLNYPPLNQIRSEVILENVIHDTGDSYTIDQEQFLKIVEFDQIRTAQTTRVISNELEPITTCVSKLEQNINLPSDELNEQLFQALYQNEHLEYEYDYQQYFDHKLSKNPKVGTPIYLEAQSRENAVLLLHGYMAAPPEMEPLAQRFLQDGISSYCARIKGHGTAPRNLSTVTMEDWIESATAAYALLKCRYQNVYIIGFSMGGLLASLLAAELKDQLPGLALINPALKLREKRAPLVGVAILMKQLFDNLKLEVGNLEYVENSPQNPHINYSQNYLRGVQQLGRTCHECRSHLNQIEAPTLIIQSTNDGIVAPDGAHTIHQQISSPRKELIPIETESHHITTDEKVDQVYSHLITFLTQ